MRKVTDEKLFNVKVIIIQRYLISMLLDDFELNFLPRYHFWTARGHAVEHERLRTGRF